VESRASRLKATCGGLVGTWKLDPAKSKFSLGTAYKDATVTFEAVGDQWKRTASGRETTKVAVRDGITNRLQAGESFPERFRLNGGLS